MFKRVLATATAANKAKYDILYKFKNNIKIRVN